MSELEERAVEQEDVQADEEVAAVDGEDEEAAGEGEEQAVRRRRARAVVLDTGRPAAPSSWRGLPAVELIRQGIAEADRKRRR